MDIRPPKILGISLGSLALLLLTVPSAISLFMLMNATLSVWMVLWVLLPLVCIPLAALVAYRLYGLLNSTYTLNRNGFYVRWGFSEERLPIQSIESAVALDRELVSGGYPTAFRWPGLIIGHSRLEDGSAVEFFASTSMDEMVLIRSEHGAFAISPPARDAFLDRFKTALRSGPLEKWNHLSRRPDFVLARLWSDPWARALILIGAMLPISLLAYLAVSASALPLQVPFGFDASGAPETLVPPGRLLLLPLAAGLCWMVDLVLGWWSYRREELRLLSYLMWAFSILVGGLFWGATLQ
ncbi:MAG: PH domain-containing protein, partial [Anaerolineales bacterium]